MDDLRELYAVIRGRREHPVEGSYTCRLLDDPELVYRKLHEECFEVVHACWHRDGAGLAEEAADLLYHLLVCLAKHGVPWETVLQTLSARRR